MEKKIGKNVSSGAEKVENIEAAQQTKEKKKTPAQKSARGQSTKKMQESAKTSEKKIAVKKEEAAAEKRIASAKAKASKKEQKLIHRAEFKQKKLERKAALKEKKLERKAMLAKKKAERKQRAQERKATLSAQRAERRAERLARREMLKNESKAEKSKRLERARRERRALKSQKAKSQEKAREDRAKARRAAHERRAEERKHKREQRTERRKHAPGFGGWLAAVISLGTACLVLATVVTAGALRMNDMTAQSESGYRATLYELVSVSEDMDGNLSKLRVSSGANEQRRLLTEVLVDSALMESAIEKLPVDGATGSDLSAFVNRTNRYARTMLTKLASGKALTQEEKETLTVLYEINATLCSELNHLATHMTERELRDFLSGKDGSMSETFGRIGQELHGSSEDFDAPFSQSGNVGENRLSKEEEVSCARAEELVKEYFAAYRVKDAKCTGETVMPDMTCYNFVLTDENDVEIFAQVSKNGGKLVFFDTYEVCSEKNFDLDTCDGIARKFLKELGMENMEAVWLSDGGMVANLTYVTVQDGVRVYSDTVRVRVCESKGRVVGIDAEGYLLNNRRDRDLDAGLTRREAEAMLGSEVQPYAAHLALIPVNGKEVLTYEFACKYGEAEYIVYLDANTGEEVEVYEVLNSAQGRYLR